MKLTTLIPAVLSLGLFAGTSPDALGAGDTFTIWVCCGSQGIVDQAHTMQVDVEDADGNCTSVTIDIPALTDSEAMAGLLETELEMKGVSDTTTGESSQKPANQAEDVTLPDGYSVKCVVVKKGGSKDDGHLKVLDSDGDIISNKKKKKKATPQPL